MFICNDKLMYKLWLWVITGKNILSSSISRLVGTYKKEHKDHSETNLWLWVITDKNVLSSSISRLVGTYKKEHKDRSETNLCDQNYGLHNQLIVLDNMTRMYACL